MKAQTFFSLEKLIAETIIDFKKRALDKCIEFQTSDDLVTYISVKGQPEKWSLLLNSILNNAMANTNATMVCFSVRELSRSANDIKLEFCIEDNGTSNKHTRNFRYHRTLASVSELVHDLHGEQEFIMHPNHSSSYTFTIKTQWQTSEPEHTISKSFKGKLKGKRVLLVEDNEVNQKIMLQMLRREGVIVDVASDGKQAITQFENNYNYDLIIMDLYMPNVDGMQANRYIRNNISIYIPIIALSANPSSMEQYKCYRSGINYYMGKPFAQEELVTQLRNFLVEEQEPVKMLEAIISKIAV